jgi:DNA-binding beta-propeller fold protein YncE
MRAAVGRPESSYAVVPRMSTFGSIAADQTGVWVADALDDRVVHVDAASATVDRAVPVGDVPEWIAAGEGGVWVLTLDGTVWRIDPDTFEVVATIPIGENPGGIAVGEGAVWVVVHPPGPSGS